MGGLREKCQNDVLHGNVVNMASLSGKFQNVNTCTNICQESQNFELLAIWLCLAIIKLHLA